MRARAVLTGQTYVSEIKLTLQLLGGARATYVAAMITGCAMMNICTSARACVVCLAKGKRRAA